MVIVQHAHTGASADIDITTLNNIQDLRQHIEAAFHVPSDRQLLLTTTAHTVDFAELDPDSAIFVYDRLTFASAEPPEPVVRLATNVEATVKDSLTSLHQDYQAVISSTSVYKLDVLENFIASQLNAAEETHTAIEEALIRSETMRRAAQAAMDHLTRLSNNFIKRYTNCLSKSQKLNNALLDHNWRQTIYYLTHIQLPHPLHTNFSTLVSTADIESLGSSSERLSQGLRETLRTLNTHIESLKRSTQIVQYAANDFPTLSDLKLVHSTSEGFLDSVRLLSNNVEKEIRLFKRSSGSETRSIDSLLHATLPQLTSVMTEFLNQHYSAYEATYIKTRKASPIVLNKVATYQSSMIPVKRLISTAETDQRMLEDITTQLVELSTVPTLYGKILIEIIRRKEWNNEKSRALSRVSAGYNTVISREQARRDSFIHSELSLAGSTLYPRIMEFIPEDFDEIPTGSISTSDVVPAAEVYHSFTQYMKSLEESNYKESEIDSLKSLFADTEKEITTFKSMLADSATGDQTFKSGAIGSRTLERPGSGLLNSGTVNETTDETVTKLNEKVAMYEQRVRRLEDLLHKSAVVTRFQNMSLELNSSRSMERSASPALTSTEAAGCSSKQEILESRTQKADTLSKRLWDTRNKISALLHSAGLKEIYKDGALIFERLKHRRSSDTVEASDSLKEGDLSIENDSHDLEVSGTTGQEELEEFATWIYPESKTIEVAELLQIENAHFETFLSKSEIDIDAAADAIAKRIKAIEALARRWQKEAKYYKEKSSRLTNQLGNRIAFRAFKVGDLALFLPTRSNARRQDNSTLGAKPWAAFNIGAPHYFLKENEQFGLGSRDWLLGRIMSIEEHIVDVNDPKSLNPMELSDGVRWYLLEALEEKNGSAKLN
ncbi:hypothetical protein CANCADRAFT_57459 [Tortispora caseinolytica NRRL Y-17796]|uniref:Autophagy-related protein 11 n=1 Tax=Tortispora caseinolytica NRRL Y-17796 TaxID=767744 RepID=A0A1E4TH91_9ASCO|nr:hypothetical protein CANCADRAFT_57459 [Tortispora caseinolytica NRRL Y-17796]